MASNPTFTFSTQSFPQRWDGASIELRFLVLPQGDPTAPLLAGAPAFCDAAPSFTAQLIPSLDLLPAPGDVTSTVALSVTPLAGARALYTQLASQFSIAPDPPGNPPRRSGYRTRKYLPQSYRNAFAFDRPSTPFAVTDDTYHCMLENGPPFTMVPPPPPSTVSWGRVIGFALRQPVLARALGLLYETTVALPDPGFFANGGWIYVDLATGSDFAAQVAASPSAFQTYAARIPPLSAARTLFAAVLFPVSVLPLAGSYDSVIVEAEDFDDGFVKIVHGSQSATADPLATAPEALPAPGDIGIQLGWDDEQITSWFNRQVDATQVDAPVGVAAYCVDVRDHATGGTWNSLCGVTANLALGSTALGTFRGELGVEAVPVRHDPAQPGEWWLPAYFTNWRGGSLVVPDAIAHQLHGDTTAATQVYAPTADATATPLLYGHDYDVRVRMLDLSRGGPGSADEPVNPGPAPIGVLPCRRMVPFKAIDVQNRDDTSTPAAPQTSYTIARPLLNYPAVTYANVPNAVSLLLADLPAAQAAEREAALPDPDAVALFIDVQVRALASDASVFAENNDNAPYMRLYTTTRAFPGDPTQPLTLDIDFQDVPDVAALPVQPTTGPLVLPRAREVRLVLRAAAAPDPTLAYWGAQSVADGGGTVEIFTGANARDERNIFARDTAADQIRAIMLQPGADAPVRLAQALGLTLNTLTYSAPPRERVLFGCSSALRHSLSPEHGAVTFSSNDELTNHWLAIVTLRLDRDWSWASLAPVSFDVRDGTGTVVGSIVTSESASVPALQPPIDRSGTNLIFIDAVDPKPPSGIFPDVRTLTYSVTPVFAAPPGQVDPPLTLSMTVPIASPPLQTPILASAGIALTPYVADPLYASTEPQNRALWLEFEQPLADRDDAYFARVVAYAPDQLLTGAPFANPNISVPPEPPLPIDPELIRVIAPGESDDRAGLGAMQQLQPSDSDRHFLLPLPPGLAVDAPELFGLFVYELRVGHSQKWSTAQGRFGNPLRVAGVQHPAPTLFAQVNNLPETIVVSAPFATPVFNGRNLLPTVPRTLLWALLYAQVAQADGASWRNILLANRILEGPSRKDLLAYQTWSSAMAQTLWDRSDVQTLLAALALPVDAPLSLVVVETFKDLGNFDNPLGGDLGQVRIVRASPLTAIPAVC